GHVVGFDVSPLSLVATSLFEVVLLSTGESAVSSSPTYSSRYILSASACSVGVLGRVTMEYTSSVTAMRNINTDVQVLVRASIPRTVHSCALSRRIDSIGMRPSVYQTIYDHSIMPFRNLKRRSISKRIATPRRFQMDS